MASRKPAQDDFDDIEDVIDDVFPAIILSVAFATIILSIFLLRHYTRYTVPCTSKNKLDGKTVIITGKRLQIC